MSKFILIALTAFGSLLQIFALIAARRIGVQFTEALVRFVDFLIVFEETPRSKFAKKYMSPLDVLQEETSSMYAETVRTMSSRAKPNRMIGNLGASRHESTATQGFDVPNFGGNYVRDSNALNPNARSNIERPSSPQQNSLKSQNPLASVS